MGDYGVSYDKITDEEEVKYVTNEDNEDWSMMDNTCTEEDAANVAEDGDQYYYEDGINYEVEYSYSCESSQQVAGEGAITSGYGHRRVRSASGGHKSFLLGDDQIGSFQSSEKDEYAKVKTSKPKKEKKGRHFGHLREPSLDAHSDPGYGDDSYLNPDYARSQSINLVSSWLRDASFGEHLKDDSETPPHAYAQPTRRPPSRRPPPRADMVACSASLPDDNNMGYHHETYPPAVQYNDKTPAYDPVYGDQYYPEVHYENKLLAIYDTSASSVPGSYYRLEEKPLDKALKFMRNGAVGFANVSKTAAVGLRAKSIELKNVAIPVMKPIFNAVLEESKLQLMGPDIGRGRATPRPRPNSAAELQRMATPYVSSRGRGRALVPRPMLRPPTMRPNMPPGQRPGMRPVMPAGQRPLMRPGMRPAGMPPQGAVPPMAVSAARGQGVPMRGHPQPRGRARPAGPTDHHLM